MKITPRAYPGGRAVLTSGILALIVTGLLFAGPLDPPAGPVGPTHKTLTEVEPRIPVGAATTPGNASALFRITQPGSYYLVGNITGAAGKHGIEITADGVTLDLNGFDLVGLPGMGAFDGVSANSLRNVTVLNGSVRNWGDGGVDLGFTANGCRIEGVLASGNAGLGINGGIGCFVSNCTATSNTLSGIRANNGSTIARSSAHSNTGSGIQVNHGCTISGFSAYQNSGGGILAGSGCTITDGSAYTNVGHGIQAGDAGSVTRCSTQSNTGRGINVGDSSTVADCSASFNNEGIRATIGGSISGCTARSNTGFGIVGGSNAVVRGCTATANGNTGIHTNQGVVSNCTSSHNSLDGITVLNGSTVTDCTVFSNTGNGIECLGASLIRGNTCSANGNGAGDGAGIVAFSGDNRIEGNVCTIADRGIDVRVAGNIIIRNTCSGNTIDWVIVAGNAVGPILDRRNPGNGAISGFSSPTSLNTTDPHANFSH